MREYGWPARAAVVLVTVLLAGVALNGCSAEPVSEVTIFGPWTDEEQAEFEAVLKKFEEYSEEASEKDPGKTPRVKTRYEGHRDVSQVLQVAIERGRPPDVVVLPRLNDLQQYVNAGRLVPLTNVLGADAAPQLIKLAPKSGSDGPTVAYGVAMATHLKSVVWYDPAQLATFGPQPPRTWPELVAQTKRRAGDQQVRWCLAMSSQPVSGWPGTDWIEDILLHHFGQDTYQSWTSGKLAWTSDEVKSSWTTWGELLDASSPGTDLASLYTTLKMAAKGLLADETPADGTPPGSTAARRCHLDHQGSFAIREYRKHVATSPSPAFSFFPTPAPADKLANSSLQEVSDDVAAMFRDTGPAGQLMKYLAGEAAQKARRDTAAEVAFSRRTTPLEEYKDPVTRAVAQRLRTATLCWDGSDLLPAVMATAFERAVMVYLKDRSRLDSLLAELDALRAKVPESDWMDLSCVPAAKEGT
ncbi:ABC transporter substrate-binding protein [Micromonospora sp. NPDC049044]|uniref:ABC transporter substrate-binding protein n=1 Tax=unclassified Micromonospora TaxID=2617518 RepID=UPI0033C403B5